MVLAVHLQPQLPNLLALRFGNVLEGTCWSAVILTYTMTSRRRAGAQASKPNSTRAAGAGGSSNTMLKLYTDDSPGLRVYVPDPYQPLDTSVDLLPLNRDPFIVLVLSLSFIGSIFFLHISAKIIRAFSK
jgi:protein transport protein SEC61 subunit beta